LKLQDDERRRIARDLHDITGQKLAAPRNDDRSRRVGHPCEHVLAEGRDLGDLRFGQSLGHEGRIDERKIGEEPFEDPTQGRQVGERDGEDPTGPAT